MHLRAILLEPILLERDLMSGSFTPLVQFSDSSVNGGYPLAAVTNVNGTLYGTTSVGAGSAINGTLFSYTLGATAVQTVAIFNGTNGATPQSDLLDVGGVLYGTTAAGGTGGAAGLGTLFSYDIASGTLATLVDFSGSANGSTPLGGLVDAGGTLYGTTSSGGNPGDGTLFSYVPGAHAVQTVVSFNGTNGGSPEGDLIDVSGTLYGTTYSGGSANFGTLYSYVPGASAVTTLGRFSTAGSSFPTSGVIDVGGVLYGTASAGGSGGNAYGSIFSYNLATQSFTQSLASFATNGISGDVPIGGLTDIGGTLYGTTSAAGSQGVGTIFAYNIAANTITQVYTFSNSGSSGGVPKATLTAIGNTLYGTTSFDGSLGFGTLFAYTPACYASGTHILTASGPVAVEHLAVGMRLPTASGRLARIAWLGHRTVEPARHPRPHDMNPIRVRAHAFGHAPARDLLLSPDHAVLVEGVLIPIRHLANGSSIAQEPRASITYWHVELDRHDAILAEGLACESYLETGNRNAFEGEAATRLHPDFTPHQAHAEHLWAERGCAPILTDPAAAALRRHHTSLLARARRAA